MSGTILGPLWFLTLASTALAIGEDDKVTALPGLLFTPNFASYSGYLNASTDGTLQMHYWLTESRSDPSKDPILVWYNGGPGCSSFGCMFEELGPFYVTRDGKSVFENVHGWNQKANVLAPESPVGVGFSYQKGVRYFTKANDDYTAQQNYLSLKDFFSRVQTKFAGRDFYLSGESYAGVYVPTLAKLLVDGIMSGDFPNSNFKGIAVGNGYLHVKHILNSQVLWSIYHGLLGLENLDAVKARCCGGTGEVDHCQFSDHITCDNGLDYDTDGSWCGNMTAPLMNLDDNMDSYNYNQDCYTGTGAGEKMKSFKRSLTRRRRPNRKAANPADTHWQDSTDPFHGYPCWGEDAVKVYANRKDVWDAIHIRQEWRDLNLTYEDCNDPMYDNYNVTYVATNDVFDHIIRKYNQSFRILIFNGDVDTICNWLGDAWLVRAVAEKAKMKITLPHQQWYFRNQTAGYIQRYANGNNSLILDLMSVKGAGHFVSLDRPGQAAQMIAAFMFSKAAGGPDYNDHTIVDPTPAPLPLIDDHESSTKGVTGMQSIFLATSISAILILGRAN